MSEIPDVSIVIVNWNGLELTTAAIRSITQGTRGVSYELIVVDNGSQDASVVELTARFPQAHLIDNRTNLGFGTAVNQGFRRAAGRYLLTLNNDTRVLGNTIGDSVAYLDAHPGVGALGVLHCNDGSPVTVQASAFNLPTPLTELLAMAGLSRFVPPDGFDPAAERDVEWICGSYMMIPRACLAQVGLFDERFFAYDEDIDWCVRARRAGWSVRFWPGAALVHLGGGVAPFMRDKTFVHFRSRLTYLRKHHSSFAAVAYYGSMVAVLSAALAWQCARLPLGLASRDAVQERARRLARFAMLKPGAVGG